MELHYNAAGHAHAVSSTSSGESYSYDANGNMISRTYQGVTYTLSYDAENRLVQITGGSLNAQYSYDGNGTRVKAVVGTETTLYVGETFESRYSPNIPPVPLPIPPGEPPLNTEWRTYYQAAGARFAIRTQGGSHPNGGDLTTLLSDHLGSTVASVDAYNNVTRQLYDPWGEDRGGTSVLPTSRKFTGQMQAEVGLYFYNARWVDVYLNRWLQPDSIIPDPGNVLDWDRYSYVRNNPLKYSDPSGHCVYGVTASSTGINWAAACAGYNPSYNYGSGAASTSTIVIQSPPGVISPSYSNYYSNYGAASYIPVSSGYFTSSGSYSASEIQAQMANNGNIGRTSNETDGGDFANPDPNQNRPKFELADRGESRGRHYPTTEAERRALQTIMEDPLKGNRIDVEMQDTRWPVEEGWVKMEYKSGKVTIHYVLNIDLAEVDDFKFK
jgi:RHS repeat-associated protein